MTDQTQDPPAEADATGRRLNMWHAVIASGALTALITNGGEIITAIDNLLSRDTTFETAEIQSVDESTPEETFDQIAGVIAAQDKGDEFDLAKFMFEQHECVFAPSTPFVTEDKLEVDAKICSRTGDIFVRMRALDGSEAFDVFRTSAVLEAKLADAQQKTASLLVSRAFAAGFTGPLSVPEGADQVVPVGLVCYRLLSNGNILRHLSEGGVCFDQIIDGRTGAVVSKELTACRKDCG